MAEKVTDPELLAILNGEAPAPSAAAKNPKLSREAQKQWNIDHGLNYDIRKPTAPDFVGISKDEQSGLENFQPASETNRKPTVVTDPELLARLNGTPSSEDDDSSVQNVSPDSPPFMARVGRGMMDLAQGTKQIYLNATDPAAGAQYTKDVGDELATYEKGVATDPGRLGVDWARIIGSAAPAAAVPVATGAGLVGLGSAAAVGTGTGALNFVPEGGSRPKNAFYGGLGGPLGVLGGKAVGAAAGKLINTVKGRYADPAAQATAEAAEKFGVNLRAGDLRPGFSNTEDVLENVPFSGAQGRIKKQADQLVDMLKMGEDKFMPAAMKPNKQGTVPFDDPNKLMQVSINRQYATNKAGVDDLYDKMRTLSGDMKFVPNQTKATAQRLLDEHMKLQDSLQNPELIASLEGAINFKPMDFALAHKNRSAMGINQMALEKKAINGTATKTEVAAMSQLQDAITHDMETAALGKQAFKLQDGKAVALPSNAVPGVQTRLERAWKVADQAYRTRLAPYNKAHVQKIMDGEFDTDVLTDRYLKEDRPLLAKGILDLMDNDGKEAAKYAVYKRAQNAAADPDLAAGISNKAFLNKIGLGKSNQEIFSPKEQEYLNEIADVLRHTRRAASHNFNPKTGNRAAQLIAGGTLLAPFGMTDLMTAGGLTVGGGLMGRGLNSASWSRGGKALALSPSDIPGLELLAPGLNSLNTGLGSQALMQVNRPKKRER